MQACPVAVLTAGAFSTDSGHVVAAEFVDECNVDDEVGISSNVGTLDDQIPLSGHTILFHNGWDVAPFR